MSPFLRSTQGFVMAFGYGKKWWKRASGLSNAQRKVSKKIGVNLSGRNSSKSGCRKRMGVFLAAVIVVSAVAYHCFF